MSYRLQEVAGLLAVVQLVPYPGGAAALGNRRAVDVPAAAPQTKAPVLHRTEVEAQGKGFCAFISRPALSDRVLDAFPVGPGLWARALLGHRQDLEAAGWQWKVRERQWKVKERQWKANERQRKVRERQRKGSGKAAGRTGWAIMSSSPRTNAGRFP